ncbi:hypothetical protein OMK64_10240 [Cellulomonas fimi]|uniref:hypothetical protein n=1 Tax=Cellulomonas fimi TaxID=1708 RepID=UPI00234D56CD|nr:hypothetical protein [Cellulomonas fimi]MDC7121914.1 hypothetical protein [Cellulomonas fimi]
MTDRRAEPARSDGPDDDASPGAPDVPAPTTADDATAGHEARADGDATAAPPDTARPATGPSSDRPLPSEATAPAGPTAPVPVVGTAPTPPVRTPPPAAPTAPLPRAVPPAPMPPAAIGAAVGTVLVPDASTPVLEAAGVGVRDRSRWLVRGLDLSLAARTVTWLVTLDPFARDATALALAGRLAVDEGHVHVVDPRDATRRSGRAVRRVVGIGWVPRLRLLEDRARVGEVVRQAHRRAGTRLDDETLDALLTDAGLAGAAGQAADDLPASQKALLGLVAAVAGDPPVVVAPFPSGSTQDRDAMTSFTERLAREGSTVLVVTAGDFRPPDAGALTRIVGRVA